MGFIFFSLSADYNFAVGLARARVPFDLRDSFDLHPADLEQYRIIAYSPRAPRAGDLEMLRRWLSDQPGRILVAHSFVPTRSAEDFWRLNRSGSLGDPSRAKILGL